MRLSSLAEGLYNLCCLPFGIPDALLDFLRDAPECPRHLQELRGHQEQPSCPSNQSHVSISRHRLLGGLTGTVLVVSREKDAHRKLQDEAVRLLLVPHCRFVGQLPLLLQSQMAGTADLLKPVKEGRDKKVILPLLRIALCEGQVHRIKATYAPSEGLRVRTVVGNNGFSRFQLRRPLQIWKQVPQVLWTLGQHPATWQY